MTENNKDLMQDWLDSQSDLQLKMPSPHPTDLFYQYDPLNEDLPDAPTDTDRKPAIDFIHWNVTALTDELHELLGETGWKPWAKSRHINLEAARGEAIDAMHFLANIFLVLGLNDAQDIMRRYHAKHAKNAKRQADGYDGVTTKCKGCHRALDDDAVNCYEEYWAGDTQGGANYRVGSAAEAEHIVRYCAQLGRDLVDSDL